MTETHKQSLWDRLFLAERPSISLSFFRIAVALTVGFHVLPTFSHLSDNYLKTAFKIVNPNFFPIPVIEFIQKSPDALVIAFVWIFCISWFFFLIGFKSQLSCIVMVVASYYFYALNAFHIGTLSWDILIVTMVLMCVTNYHSDYFSFDCALRSEEGAYKKKRPFFLQRLLQMQVAFMYFYTGFYKVTAEGNWISDNPIYYLMNYPPAGVTKTFLLKDFIMDKPELCYISGLLIVATELSMPFLLFYRRTRLSAIYLGFIFHIMLILTLDVPAIFFFLFPPQLLLFIDPDDILGWIEKKRAYNRLSPRSQLVFDGHCQFCLRSVGALKTMDLFDTLKYVDLHQISWDKEGKAQGYPIAKEKAMSQFHLIEPDGKLYGGFDVFRRLCWTMPMLYPFIFVFYFPGAGVIGPALYRLIAKNRYLFHFNKICRDNACFAHPSGN